MQVGCGVSGRARCSVVGCVDVHVVCVLVHCCGVAIGSGDVCVDVDVVCEGRVVFRVGGGGGYVGACIDSAVIAFLKLPAPFVFGAVALARAQSPIWPLS